VIDGPSLAERIGQVPMPLDEALATAKQIVDAIEAAHEKGRFNWRIALVETDARRPLELAPAAFATAFSERCQTSALTANRDDLNAANSGST
jgi:hypothetical protein